MLGNSFEVGFVLENASGSNFTAPGFEGFEVIGGPNHASSFQMINGKTTQSSTISYYLQPKETGAYTIGPASIVADGEEQQTEGITVYVLPNPEGIQQQAQPRQRSAWDDFFDNPVQPQRPVAPRKPKKKRKVYKL